MLTYLEKSYKFSNRATDEQMKAWLIKDIKETVKPKSITTLSLNMADIRPENFIIIPIPIYWQTSGIEPGHVKRCPLDDGTYVYSMWRVQILVLTKHYISLFKCNYDWFSNSISSISTNEFYFQDITEAAMTKESTGEVKVSQEEKQVVRKARVRTTKKSKD